MPLMPWWAPAVLGVTYLLSSLILRLIPSPADRPEDRQQAAAQHRQDAEHCEEHHDHDDGVAGNAARSRWLLSHGVERGDWSP